MAIEMSVFQEDDCASSGGSLQRPVTYDALVNGGNGCRRVMGPEEFISFLDSRYHSYRSVMERLHEKGFYTFEELSAHAKRSATSDLAAKLGRLERYIRRHPSERIVLEGLTRLTFISSDVLRSNDMKIGRRRQYGSGDDAIEPSDEDLRQVDVIDYSPRKNRHGNISYVGTHPDSSRVPPGLLTREGERVLFTRKAQLEEKIAETCSVFGAGYDSVMAMAYVMVHEGYDDFSRGRNSFSKNQLLRRLSKVVPAVDEIDRIKDVVVLQNMRLVLGIARKRMAPGMDFDDLSSEGITGLMRAFDRFEYWRGFKFSTYATWWVRQAISRAHADKGSTIRTPVHVYELFRKIKRTISIAELDPVEKARLDSLGDAPYVASKTRLPEEKIRKAIDGMRSISTVSLNMLVGEEDISELGDFVADTSIIPPSTCAEDSDVSRKLEQLVSLLSEKEAGIIRKRFGLGLDRNYTLEEIARITPSALLGTETVTRERIRQIEEKALRRLRRNALFSRTGRELRKLFEGSDEVCERT